MTVLTKPAERDGIEKDKVRRRRYGCIEFLKKQSSDQLRDLGSTSRQAIAQVNQKL